MKKILAIALTAVLALGLFAGCNGTGTKGFDTNKNITVITREEGSGTRGAFVELMGVETEEGDMTTKNAETANSTSLVQSTVSGNAYAIGYISLGSYDASAVKALKVDGIEATAANVKAGTYPVYRPFVLCYQEANLTELGRDFLNYIMSTDGQKILTDNGYISGADSTEDYTPSGLTGSLSLNGSTSIGPVMEKLAEAYMGINSGVTIDIQQTGSGTGITSAIDGSCEIGMSSRALKDEEASQGLTSLTIALDGIAVVVNQENTTDGLTSEQIRKIFTGEITTWKLG